MTNVLLLPQIDGPNTSFAVSNNADWVDAMYFGQPGYGAPIALSGCTLATGSNIIGVSSTAGIQPGMSISPAPGLASGGYVGAITSATNLSVVDSGGGILNATASTVAAYLTFSAPPLDLSGIQFIANLRPATGSTRIFLTAQTLDGTMINFGWDGILRFNVPLSLMQQVSPGNYVLDILAMADNYNINLMQNGPASVLVNLGISDSTVAQSPLAAPV